MSNDIATILDTNPPSDPEKVFSTIQALCEEVVELRQTLESKDRDISVLNLDKNEMQLAIGSLQADIEQLQLDREAQREQLVHAGRILDEVKGAAQQDREDAARRVDRLRSMDQWKSNMIASANTESGLQSILEYHLENLEFDGVEFEDDGDDVVIYVKNAMLDDDGNIRPRVRNWTVEFDIRATLSTVVTTNDDSEAVDQALSDICISVGKEYQVDGYTVTVTDFTTQTYED